MYISPFAEILSGYGEIQPDRLPRAKLCCFSAKPDRCDRRARRSDGCRCCNRASMNFNAFAGCIFLRLPRSCRVMEKSDLIGSREPNCAVFQQNPTVVTTDLDAPMDPDAVIAQACNSIHLLGGFSPFAEIVPRCGDPIRSAPESQIMLFFRKIRPL